MTDEQKLIQEAIRSHTGAWFESAHAKIYGKNRKAGPIRPKQNYLQHKAQSVIDRLEDLDLPVRIIWLKPRQKGSTTYGCAIGYTKFRRESTSGVIIGGQVSQVDEAWEMYRTYNKNDSFDWGNTGEVNTKAGAWSNGSRLIRETAGDAKAGIGGTHQHLHGFEVARWAELGADNATEVLANIMKCVPLLPSTTILLESTAEGSVGAFYTTWISAVDAEDFLSGAVDVQPGTFIRCFAPWFAFDDSAIRLTEEQKRAIESTLDEEPRFNGERELIQSYGHTDDDGVLHLGDVVRDYDVWEQLAWRRWSIDNECGKELNKFERDYPHSWRTAFQKSGAQRFNLASLTKMRAALARRPAPLFGVIELGKGRPAFRQTEKGEAKVTIFEKPIPNRRYILSLDPMTGETQVGGKDPDLHGVWIIRDGYWDAAGKWVMPCTAARVVPCRWDVDVATEAAWSLAKYYGPEGGCMIAIEMNQDRGFTELFKLKNANLYQREIFNQREMKTTKALGYQTNEKTREVLIESLAKAIREYGTPGEGIQILCPIALDQLENFVRKASGRSEHAEGWHDDDVLAIALGYELRDHATTYHAPNAGFFGRSPEFGFDPVQQHGPGTYS